MQYFSCKNHTRKTYIRKRCVLTIRYTDGHLNDQQGFNQYIYIYLIQLIYVSDVPCALSPKHVHCNVIVYYCDIECDIFMYICVTCHIVTSV